MTVHGLSPFSAATKLLSFGLPVAGGSSIAAALMGKLKIPLCWVIFFGAILQVVGLVLLTRINDTPKIDTAQYAYQILTGLGVGFINAALTLLVPYVMDKKDLGKPDGCFSGW
jgi:dipeptide/tripeptide permease